MTEINLEKAYLTITGNCNLKCDYCYLDKNKKRDLSTNDWKKIIIILSKNGVNWVQLTGGEPLIRPDFWDILNFSHENFNKIIIATNATLINKKAIEYLSKFEKILVYISLNNWVEEKSYNSENNIFAKKIKTIKKLKNIGIDVVVSTTVSNNNFRDLPKILSYTHKNDINQRLNFISLYGRATKDLLDPVTKRYLEKFKENKEKKTINAIPNCSAGFKNISVLENGDVTPCVILRDKQYVGGNILKDDIGNIYNSNVFNKWREQISFIDEKCKRCQMFDKCKGGCPARRISYSKIYGKQVLVDAGICAWNESFEKLGLEMRIQGWE